MYIEGGEGHPCKTLDKSLPIFAITRDKQCSCLPRKRPGPKRWVRGGWGLDLEKCGIVRADQAVEAEAGLLNLQRGGAPWVGC